MCALAKIQNTPDLFAAAQVCALALNSLSLNPSCANKPSSLETC